MPTTKAKKSAARALGAAASSGPVNNCSWSNNNVACVNTWFCLSKDVLGQLDASFEDAQTIEMSELEFFNELAPGDNAAVEAAALADVLTKLFTNVLGAKYEQGQNFASAVLAMTAVLSVADKTVCELAAVVDELHHFTTERSP
jgi:hypothetical protein